MVPKSAAVDFISQVLALAPEVHTLSPLVVTANNIPVCVCVCLILTRIVLPQCIKNWTRFAEYFQLLFEFALLGAEHRKVLIQRKAVAVLGDILLGEQSPFLEKNQKREKMGNRLAQPDFNFLLKTMSVSE